jgi:hypothetical protein
MPLRVEFYTEGLVSYLLVYLDFKGVHYSYEFKLRRDSLT